MRIRTGFVSNSSSSIFMVTAEGDLIPPEKTPRVYQIGKAGHDQFGWEVREYRGIDSKINFTMLQARKDEQVALLFSVLKEHFGEFPEISLREDAYIDHQSRGGSNFEMFESKEKLKQFLFCDQSYIQGGNDND